LQGFVGPVNAGFRRNLENIASNWRDEDVKRRTFDIAGSLTAAFADGRLMLASGLTLLLTRP
jgi:hypothetical protein